MSLRFDSTLHQCLAEGFTPQESRVLAVLVWRTWVPTETLQWALQPPSEPSPRMPTTNLLKVVLYNIRRKLGTEGSVENFRGLGYALDTETRKRLRTGGRRERG